MADIEKKEFVLWYLESQGYEKTLEEVKKSLKPEKIINRKKRRKFKKIKNEIQSEPALSGRIDLPSSLRFLTAPKE